MVKYTPFQRFWGLIKSEKKTIKRIYVYAILNGLVALSLPLGIQSIISFIQLGQVSASWLVLVLIVIGGILFSGWMQILQLKASENIQERIFSKSALELAFRIPAIRSEALYKYYAPELANRFFDTLTIQKGLSKILIDFTAALMQIIFGLLLLSLYHPFFIFLGILITILIIGIVALTFRQGLETSLEESEYKYKTAHWLEEVARSVFTFKLTGNNLFHVEKTDQITSQYIHQRKKHFAVLLRQYWSMVGFKALLALSLLLIGGFLVINQNMNIGQFVAAEIVILLILNSVEKFILSMETLYDVLTAFEKLGKITDLELEDYTGTIASSTNKKGLAIDMVDVSFNYPGSSKQILQDVNCNIEAGEKICVSGKNASGKTTLLNIISTLYQPVSGVIKYDGFHLNDWQLPALREYIDSIVNGDLIFEGTLWENIVMNREGVTKEYVGFLIDRLQLRSFLDNLPEGFSAVIGTEGKALPNSIVQKILLARALAIKPKLVVIENQLNAISTFEKMDIIDFLVKEVECTIVMVSNNPLVAEKCEKVILMDKGSFVAKKPWSELIQHEEYKEVFYA